jgi:hypothetical protein
MHHFADGHDRHDRHNRASSWEIFVPLGQATFAGDHLPSRMSVNAMPVGPLAAEKLRPVTAQNTVDEQETAARLGAAIPAGTGTVSLLRDVPFQRAAYAVCFLFPRATAPPV